MTTTVKSACIYGFDTALQASLKEILYFAGAEPYEVEDITGLSKIFKMTPPDIIVMSLEALEMLDFHVMVGSDPQFDRVAIISGIRDINTPQLRRVLETCASDFFLVSQPYHLKRLAMAVMALNPWTEVPAASGKLLLADANLERRIAIARSLRIAKFDIEFADSADDLLSKIGRPHDYRMVISAMSLGQEDAPAIFTRVFGKEEFKPVPWLIYETNQLLGNTKKGAAGELIKIGSDLSPETISFHVQGIIASPMKELRKSERIPYFTPVKVIIERIREEIWGFSTDLSENGVYIRTLVPPPVGAMLTISFKAPTAEGMVQLGARVAWRKEYGSQANPSKHPGFGIEFARISEPDRAALQSGYALMLKAIKQRGPEGKP